VGIPWRTTAEAPKNREKLDYYFRAVRKAGAELKKSLWSSRRKSWSGN